MDSEHNRPSGGMGAANDMFGASTLNVVLVWASFPGAFFFGITPFIGALFAYANRRDAPPVLATHYDAAIRTFWITLVVGFIGAVLTWVLIGFAILFVLWLWTIWQAVRGIQKVSAGRPIGSPPRP